MENGLKEKLNEFMVVIKSMLMGGSSFPDSE